ncbi:hypothetical protein AAFF_G00109330 [Aldrovandia affinis]|uniref:PKD domain-containing protein n=1 Tax=Aldrovandia affinis TaxID=143900 RepID=A0AAD7WBU2_9TELE|nr:hypothetical protein AAFF_G00109330 [Aldrovandia affinis]
MYPVWKDEDPQNRNCWKGGDVTFAISNDAPTLTGAKTTFSIEIRFPPNQMVLPEGWVVWAKNGTIDGMHYQQSQAVYPEIDTSDNWNAVFPDGTPFNLVSGKKPHYVYVWKTWDRYWQVADGPSSSLTIGTDEVPLGSYNMKVVIYHIRSKEKFIPLGYACTQFSITDQVPFAMSLAQANDVNETDQSFVQNRAITFSITLHDPSQYLNDADVTFNWDFGDNSGTLISRELAVTHTYTSAGSYQPQLILQAVIPKPGCVTPVNVPTGADPTPALVTSMPPSPPAGRGSTGAALAANPPSPAVENEGAVEPTIPAAQGLTTADTATDSGVPEWGAAITVSAAVPAEEEDPVISAASTPAVMVESVNMATSARVAVAGEATQVVETEGDQVTAVAQVSVVVAKRQAPGGPSNADCVIYRYGSFSTNLDIVQGIEGVEIVQVANVAMVTVVEQHAVDLTVTCQGSLPTQVCTVVSDAGCAMPMQTVCSVITPAVECQLVLRQFFNNTGVFCVNVSMTNDVSLAVASAQVSVTMASRSTIGAVATVLGLAILGVTVCAVAFTYRHLKEYRPLKEDAAVKSSLSAGRTSAVKMIWNLLSRRTVGENHCPLLPG